MGGVTISVIIPALNAGKVIGAQLTALAAQVVDEPWEVIVVDNASVDDTRDVCHRFQRDFPELRVVTCERPGTGAARNAGAAAAHGDLLLLCDADDEVGPDWVATMAAALRHHDAVGGRIENDVLSPGRPAYLPRHPDELSVVAGFLPRALTANLGVRRDVFAAVGGFDEEYDYGCGDTEFSWRLQLASHKLVYEPLAVVHYRHRDSFTGVAVKAYRTGRSRGRLFRDYGDQGMPRPSVMGAAYRWLALVVWLPVALISKPRRWWWMDQAAGAAGRVSGSVRFGVRYL